ncbi:recombination mediator RecR [Helicobacter mustelae]|uniref:Recombination protein RecR n=1 Tax=Helicobacter mustelae (strain ATCC 43772 / CCUG 25715 / CIP 103759 / LMG 18044 / NCTC 12198 / R85-136P) TaxID=679897 RepID=D3UJ14_HELM1|nr:recombination mediator RecR [Helicobacter mustelae]CBG40489.1 recombination protein [Helicobacter mustelae 12198]SQH71988.1 recombination protein [Helicobacter mustelae]STP13131.1 recombination protein [Helicobacter mustelae]
MKSYKNNLRHFNALLESLEQIPAIGKKSALKIAYAISVENKFLGLKIAHCIENAISHARNCSLCNALSENELCDICSDENRDSSQLCMVLHSKDIFTIEETGDYKGLYFVIQDPKALDFSRLQKQILDHQTREIIFAFSPTLANDAIMLYIEDKLQHLDLSFSKIAQGVPTGIGLDNVDQLSLSKAILWRTKI